MLVKLHGYIPTRLHRRADVSQSASHLGVSWFRILYAGLFLVSPISALSSCIHGTVSLATGPRPLPKRVFHDLALPLSISSILSFSQGHPVAAYVFFLVFTSPLPPPSMFPSIKCFRWQFLRTNWPIQLTFLLFTLCRLFLSPLTLCDTSSFLTRSVQLVFSSTTFHNFPGIPGLFSEVSKFQHYTKLCSKRSTSLFSSLNLNPVCSWKESSSFRMLLFPWQSWL